MPTNPTTKPSLARRKSRPYEPTKYPEERIQIDVKNTFQKNTYFIKPFIEKYDRTDLYQYTAIDEYFWYRIVYGYRERHIYSSSLFLYQVASQFKALGTEVVCAQTDNGAELTKQCIAVKENNHSIFKVTAHRLNIRQNTLSHMHQSTLAKENVHTAKIRSYYSTPK